MTRIAFLGLGRMGLGMACRLVDKGHDVVVWNRSAAKAKPGPKPKAAAPTAPKAALKVKTGQRRSQDDIATAAGDITRHLRANGAARVDQMAAALAVAVKDLQLPIAWLLKHKKLTKKGKLRGTTYTAKG